ncbi:DUF2332 domain-containing protein [Prosthecomicrobium sp. N25]|uniref:DUF2332 domain-containing protein n=1 Tax=Prosthecomicrobium sp. N25 TaxID=3129254 RepID=UPI0030787594
MTDERIRKDFEEQAAWCDRLGSPFTAAVMRAAAAALDRSTQTGRAILDWPGAAGALADSVPLRLGGALHGLVRAGRLPRLAPLYPPNPMPDADGLAAALGATLAEADAEIRPWIDRPPQTNEVGRSAALYAGLVTVAGLTGLPLAVHEVGASAGLNLNLDRYAYDLGGRLFGDPASPVRLRPEWRGAAPEGPDPLVVSRRGCDLTPIRIADPEERRRLAAYVWPDQPERLARLEAALAVAARHPPEVDAMDAAAWVRARLGAAPQPGVARVLQHSIAFQYFPADGQAAITAHMEALGASARADTPLAWIAYEMEEGVPTLTLRLWPGGTLRRLAVGNAHVSRLDWQG